MKDVVAIGDSYNDIRMVKRAGLGVAVENSCSSLKEVSDEETTSNNALGVEKILDKIWDVAGNFVNDNTLTVYIKRIREKLDDKDGNIIKTVRGRGYIIEGD